MIAPPLYVITTSTPEKQDGIQILNDACKAIEDRILASGGSFNIQMAPKVVTATDEQDLAKQLERAEQENAEVSFSLKNILTRSKQLHLGRFLATTMMRMKNRLEWVERYQRAKRVTKEMKKIKHAVGLTHIMMNTVVEKSLIFCLKRAKRTKVTIFFPIHSSVKKVK